MSAALPPTVKHASAVGHMSKERVVKGIEQTWCRVSKSARGDGKFAANAATPVQYASAGDSPPTTLLYFSIIYMNACRRKMLIGHTQLAIKVE